MAACSKDGAEPTADAAAPDAPPGSGDGGMVPRADVVLDDASADYDEAQGRWVFATAGISKTLELRDGVLTMTSLYDKLSDRELVPDGSGGAEFSIVVDGTPYDGRTGGWSLDQQEMRPSDDGSIAIEIALGNATLAVRLHYDVWPGTAVIEHWIEYENRTGADVEMTAPGILDATVMKDELAARTTAFDYFQGGRDTPDALRLLEDVPDDGWVETLASDHFGADAYLQEVLFRDWLGGGGALFGWSHASRWTATFDASGHAHVEGVSRSIVAPGATVVTPRAHTMIFDGDVDDAGNALKEWQYLHKWDRTDDRWAAAVKPYLWDAGHSYTPERTFELTQAYRHVGADIWHWDDHWYDRAGDWNNITTTDMTALDAFAQRNGLVLMVWMPIWAAASGSAVLAAHPDWGTTSTACTTAQNLDLSNDAAVDWMIERLGRKTEELGPWIWRQDFGGGAFDGAGVDPMHASANYYRLMDTFKAMNPGVGINVNHCGGQQMSVEALRYADIVQTTDLQPGRFSVYTPTYVFPPDKLWGGIDRRNLDWSATRTDLRGSLGTAWQWDGNGGTPTPDQLEAFRVNADLYHFMISIGVAGRFSKMYHPDRVTNDDRTYYLQRMSRDGTRGVILSMHSHYDPSFVTVYPKGLDPSAMYTVRFQNNPGFAMTNTGQHWMTNGIGAVDWGGDLVWLNVDDYPGAGTDTTPPSAPPMARRAAATYMGFAGVEITWRAADDDNWVSYYEVFRDGTPIGRSARATFLFDEAGDVSSAYEVVAVDGDGNASPRAPATE